MFLVSFFQSVGELFQTFAHIIVSIFESLIRLVTLLVSVVALPTAMAAYLPAVLLTSLIVLVAVQCLHLITGR